MYIILGKMETVYLRDGRPIATPVAQFWHGTMAEAELWTKDNEYMVMKVAASAKRPLDIAKLRLLKMRTK
jgi:hypothetical protein